ncbi:hypothetical protein C4D60_Mb02t13210 [Musa balbisiana]|uniref:Uncharacterized protein n=1 Tax=Musa balbisiana TaxID=52838 RepID=A0A4S8IBQ1_MUSBA|nr:hypothetical protein C4D60_Mb02t13210 [Musa balbisiana]
MAIPGPYSGVSTLAFVARASAFAFGVVYGSVKLSYLQVHQINLHSQKLKAASIGIFLRSAEGFMLSNVLLGWLVNQGDHFGFCEAIIFFIVSVRFIEGKLGSRLRRSITRRKRQKATTEEQNVVCGDSLTA